MSFIQPRSAPLRSILIRTSLGLALAGASTGCAWNRLTSPTLAVTAVPHVATVTAEPAPPPDSSEWITITPLRLETGQMNLEIANHTAEDVTVRWGSAALVGLDGSRHGLEVDNLKLDAHGELSVPSELRPYSVVQVRMTPDRPPRFPVTASDSAEAQRLCEETAQREMQLTLPVQKGSERRIYTVHLVSDVHVTLTSDGRTYAFTCSGSGAAPGM